MLNLKFSSKIKEALHYERFHHPHPMVQMKMEVIYLKSQGLKAAEIQRLCAISKATYHRYLKEYQTGGIERLKQTSFSPKKSELDEHKDTLEKYFLEHPPATAPQAQAKILELTGIRRGLTQVRQFLHSLGMKPRKVAPIPAKANVEAQEEFKKKFLEPRLAQAQAGKREVFFVDAAHFVYGAFLGMLWCVKQMFIKTPSGRQRLNVLGALHAITREIFTVQNLTYINAVSVCELLKILSLAYPGRPITVVMDNARYQRCLLVQDKAKSLGIELLYLPPYSPNLNLIERFWKFVKKSCLYSKYYPDDASFKQAIQECISSAPTQNKSELETLLSLNFQSFKGVPIVENEPQKKSQ